MLSTSPWRIRRRRTVTWCPAAGLSRRVPDLIAVVGYKDNSPVVRVAPVTPERKRRSYVVRDPLSCLTTIGGYHRLTLMADPPRWVASAEITYDADRMPPGYLAEVHRSLGPSPIIDTPDPLPD
jgi:hypothetical protein